MFQGVLNTISFFGKISEQNVTLKTRKSLSQKHLGAIQNTIKSG